MDTLLSKYGHLVKDALTLTKTPKLITEDNVYQVGVDAVLPYLDMMVEESSLPGSGLDGMENLEELWEKARSGSSCLLLPEHYSNLDLSIITCFIRKAGGHGEEMSRAVVAIAGMKLTEDDPSVAAFAAAYSRIVIYPSRSLAHLDAEKDRAEILRSTSINRAAMKALNELKTQGKLILVFPAGTRYRAWDPATKRGVREIDSYIRSFDYMCCIALNGQILHVHQKDMMEDEVRSDLVRVTAGPVLSCVEFRKQARAAAGKAGIEDKKQATVDAIMAELEAMHEAAEPKRTALLKQ